MRNGEGMLGNDRKWQPIAAALFDCDLELAVIFSADVLAFPCRRILGGWMNAETKERLKGLRPTHWREWVPTP